MPRCVIVFVSPFRLHVPPPDRVRLSIQVSCHVRRGWSAHRVVLFLAASSLAYSMPLHSGARVHAPSTRLRCDPFGSAALRGEAYPLLPPLRVAVSSVCVRVAASLEARWPTARSLGTCCLEPHRLDATANCRVACHSAGPCTCRMPATWRTRLCVPSI